MMVLGISGSPRRGGNSDALLDEALKGAVSAGAFCDKIILNDLDISPCQECDVPSDNGSCIINDDMDIVYKKIGEADGIIISSPIFFGSVSAQTKMMIDRFQCYWRSRYAAGAYEKAIARKKGAFISVSASGVKKQFDNAASVIKNFFATIEAAYVEELFCADIEDKDDAAGRPDLLASAFEMGLRIGRS